MATKNGDAVVASPDSRVVERNARKIADLNGVSSIAALRVRFAQAARRLWRGRICCDRNREGFATVSYNCIGEFAIYDF